MKSRILVFMITIMLLPLASWAQEIPLTLDEALAIALRDNRDILLKAEDVQKAKLKIAEAQASLFPTLNFTGSWTDTQGYFNKDVKQTSTQTTLKQYLYKGGKIVNTIQYNGYKFEVAQSLLDKSKLETALNVKKAFYTLLLAGEFAGLNKDIVDNTQEHLDFFKERYKYGQASENDILSLQSSLEKVRQAYQSSLSQAESSRVLLNNLLYLDSDTKIKPEAKLNYEPAELAYDAAFVKAMRERPEIKQYEAQAQADRKNIEVTKADNRPNIYASWDYYSKSHLSTGVKNWNDYQVLGITFSWPIFDGWATKSKVEQAIVDLKATQLLREKTASDIALELKNAYLSLKNALAKIDATDADLQFYRDNLASVQEKHKDGIASLLDLDDASLKTDISVFNQKQAVYDYIIAKNSFEKATGGI